MPYELLRWRQSGSNKGIDLVISIEPPEHLVARKFRVEVSNDQLRLFRNQAQILTWVLFDAVHEEPQWETKEEELHVGLTRKSDEMWKSALRNPLSRTDQALCTGAQGIHRGEDMATDPIVLSLDQLDQMLLQELEPTATATSEDEKMTEPDPEAILDDLLSSKTSSPLPKYALHERQRKIEKEIEAATVKLEQLQKECRELENLKPSLLQERDTVKHILQCCDEINQIFKKPLTVLNMIEALKLDLIKEKLSRGEGSKEEEIFQNSEEENMSSEELYIRGILSLEQSKPHEGLHFLRLAALGHKHTQSTMTLVRLYMESGLQITSLQLLLDKSANELEPLSNFTTAQMFENDVANFTPAMALALYFYQRAATQGETSAMCFAAQLLLRGGCIAAPAQENLCQLPLAARWMEQALERGSCLAYKLMLERFLGPPSTTGGGGDPILLMFERLNEKPNYGKAKKYYQFLSDTNRELLELVPHVEQRLEVLRKETEPEVKSPSTPLTLAPESGLSQPSGATRESASLSQQNKAEERLKRFGGIYAGARAHMQEHEKGFSSGSSGDHWRNFWELTASITLVTTGCYILAFPLRVMIMPQFFEFLERVLLLLPWNKRPTLSPHGLL